jgi:hypothetical protein
METENLPVTNSESQIKPKQAPKKKAKSSAKAPAKKPSSSKASATGKSQAKGKQSQALPKKAAPLAPRPYPRATVLSAIVVAQKIKELNGGNAWDTAEVAEAMKLSKAGSQFFYVTAAARDFGFILGSRDAKKIELTPFGRDSVYAPDLETERQKRIEAFLHIPIFKSVLEHYKGTVLPEMKYLGNTLEKDFKLAREYHEEFATLFRKNCEELGITEGIPDQNFSNANGKHDNLGSATLTVVGEPKNTGKNQLRVFVIMPFVERAPGRAKGFFSEVLKSLLVPAGTAAGFEVKTANKQGSEVIQSTIVNELIDADLVIADLTDHNPNVLFELGVRLALEKPVAIIKSSDTGRVFDIDNMLRVYEYDANLWNSTISKDVPGLIDHITATWENRHSDIAYIKLLRRQPMALTPDYIYK